VFLFVARGSAGTVTDRSLQRMTSPPLNASMCPLRCAVNIESQLAMFTRQLATTRRKFCGLGW
jgi:hypothetical protein